MIDALLRFGCKQEKLPDLRVALGEFLHVLGAEFCGVPFHLADHHPAAVAGVASKSIPSAAAAVENRAPPAPWVAGIRMLPSCLADGGRGHPDARRICRTTVAVIPTVDAVLHVPPAACQFGSAAWQDDFAKAWSESFP